jgi:hypothetical protein
MRINLKTWVENGKEHNVFAIVGKYFPYYIVLKESISSNSKTSEKTLNTLDDVPFLELSKHKKILEEAIQKEMTCAQEVRK